MKLDTAYLCADCENVTESALQCECGSRAVASIARMLNREPAPSPLRSHEVINAARALARIKLHEHASRKAIR